MRRNFFPAKSLFCEEVRSHEQRKESQGDGERRSRPRWDNPTGQLPGAGTPSGIDNGLYGTSRRRDSSVPDRTRLRSLGNDGAVSSPGETRPSGAMNRIGASGGTSSGMSSGGDNAQVLTAMANAEVRRQLEERVRASMVGTSVGAEVFHIGSPSDQTGSDFQSVRSRSTQGLSHPTTSPVSFGPIGSPSVARNILPDRAVSSPGMIDVRCCRTCLGRCQFLCRLSTFECWRKYSKSAGTSFE